MALLPLLSAMPSDPFPTLESRYGVPVERTAGPLRVSGGNPRYFVDGRGRAVYLVGSHVWDNFQDIGFEGDPPFDYRRYLEFMATHRFNFMRFWTWEHAAWATWTPEKPIFGPLPYRRMGPGLALDGKPKFDLDQFDEAYFDRMRARIRQAGDRGIYASVMLFQAFSGIWPFSKDHQNDAFRGHYYHAANNVQGLNGDRNGDSAVDLDDPAVRERQAAWIRKVVQTVGDLDNVLYEVINEGGNEDWNRFVIETVRQAEKEQGVSHPIGVTGHGGVKLDGMMRSGAEWISPGSNDGPGFEDAFGNPPAWNEKRVSVLDTDHIWGHGIDYKWVWKSFCRGHNVLFMDPWSPLAAWHDPVKNSPDHPGYEEGRRAMRNTALLASRLDLGRMAPHGELASTGYCLADPGQAYVAYAPEYQGIELDLRGQTGTFVVTWIEPITGKVIEAPTISGGEKVTLWATFPNDLVVWVRR